AVNAMCNQTITFDGSPSRHGAAPDHKIVQYVFDFDADNQGILTSQQRVRDTGEVPVTRFAYPRVGRFKAQLTVRDDNTSPLTDKSDAVTIDVTDSGIGPTIRFSKPIYYTYEGMDVTIDVSATR